MLKKFFILLLHFYQRYLSILSPGSCRYYPTCSEYAKWRVENENIIKALFFIILRILRCNQLFSGGIEYPIVIRKLESEKVKKLKSKRVKIKYWLVPTNKKDHFYLIKNIYLKKEKDV
ncbi:membrane protein insertion efficiency factor YidD [Nitrosophilus kaiyonis]|uniref:membrane protein insertion efficiency factor YidD n=1 Tax=Nitrosophilus kaiyonis TaxID=2930200 RepID=UPI0024902716|nr:membrane protein insertion efficiency factor YidD [Nitrosophilus kaiyonis]